MKIRIALYRILFLIALSITGFSISNPSLAFPLRVGEDCFYGEGEPSGGGVNTPFGYVIKFQPPYAPYTVQGVSIYIVGMVGQSSDDYPLLLEVSVLDGNNVCRQHGEFDWRWLRGRQGWVELELAPYTYPGQFTVIVNSGVGINNSKANTNSPAFYMGVDTTYGSSVSMLSSQTRPPTIGKKISQSKLGTPATFVRNFPPNGNWMIRAHAPGLQTETTHVIITDETIRARFNRNPVIEPPPLDYGQWKIPPLEGGGPKGTVRCPTSLSGITFYYYQNSQERKFLFPHEGPWIHPNLVGALASLCRDLSREGVIGIEHIGIYNDRYIYGTNVKSSHAYGLGIDISGFQFSDGRVVLVEDHDNPNTRKVLEHIRDAYLKKYFPTVLDWNYQRHDNHFHVNLYYTP